MPRHEGKNFHSLVRENISDPYRVYRDYRQDDPVHRIAGQATGREDEWVLFRYDDVATALSSRGFGRRAAVPYRGPGPGPRLIPPDFPRLANVVENWLVFMDPPRHGQLRSLIADRFAVRLRSGTLPGEIRKIAVDLIAGIGDRPLIELIGDFATPLPMLVILEIMGIPQARRGWLREHALALQDGSSFRPGNRAERLARAEMAAGDLDDYFRDEVRARRQTRHEDLIGELISADESAELLTDDVLVGTCIHLLTAGHEATTNAVSKSVLALLTHPESLDQLARRPDLLPAAVDELIRFDSPVQMVTRWAYQDEPIAGHQIRAGDKATLVLGSANRDPARFERPDGLVFDREDRRHCGFGMGIHYCLGSPLARMEVEIALSSLLSALPGLCLTDEPVQYAEDMVFHGPRWLRLYTSPVPSGLR
jgi:cytochrome P450